MFKKILVPLDFSASSELSVRVACDLAKAHGGALILLHVHEPIMGGDGQLLSPFPLDEAPEFDLRLEAVKADLLREGAGAVEARCQVGPAAAEIMQLARQEAVDLIVMGTHGRTGFKHLILGSVAERVVRKAPCPVLTLRVPEPHR